jgi:hypothetical protein
MTSENKGPNDWNIRDLQTEKADTNSNVVKN